MNATSVYAWLKKTLITENFLFWIIMLLTLTYIRQTGGITNREFQLISAFGIIGFLVAPNRSDSRASFIKNCLYFVLLFALELVFLTITADW